MRSIGTDGVPCYVGRSVTVMSPRKMAEPIEVLFGLRHRVGPRKHVLDGVQIPACEGAILRGKVWQLCCELCKTAEPIEMRFGLWTWVGSRKHVLDGKWECTLAQRGEYD